MGSDVAWREHLDTAGGAAEATAWLRTEARRWLRLMTTAGGCTHLGSAADVYFHVELDAAVCGSCAISVTGGLAGSWCARCGGREGAPRRHLAELDQGQYALVPLCSECTGSERLAMTSEPG